MNKEPEARYTLHTGEALAWLISLPTDSVDALITDPPYCSGGRTTTARRIRPSAKYVSTKSRARYPEFEGESRDQRAWVYWMSLWLTQAYRVLRPGAPACIFTDWRQYPSASSAFQAAGFVWRGVVVWDKTGAARPVRGRFINQAEFLLWGSKGPMPTGENSRRCNAESNVLPGVFKHRVDPRDKYHATSTDTLRQEYELFNALRALLATGQPLHLHLAATLLRALASHDH